MGEVAWLGAVRHGESIGNIAASRAELSGAVQLDLNLRDADVPLSELGQEQAASVQRWLAALPAGQRPGVVLVSPYLRAAQTAQAATAGLSLPLAYDERLRDRDLGILDLLSSHGVLTRHPEEAARRRRLGKFYYRPPGGESWADVALRLRTLLADIRRDHPGGRVLVVTHDVVVQLIRYLLEDLTEADLVALSAAHVIANASISTWRRDGGGRLRLEAYNDVGHLHRQGTAPTSEEGVRAEPV